MKKNYLEYLDIRKSFKKDFDLPVVLLDKNLFLERVKILGFENELKNYLSIIDNFKNVQEFFDYRNDIRQKAIEYIKNNSLYKDFNNNKKFDFEVFNKKFNYDTLIKETNNLLKELKKKKINITKNLYNQENLNKKYISIDLKSANFQILKLLDIIEDKRYEDFINRFDKFKYFYKSKHIRQYIFGNTNSKKIVNIQKAIMILILIEILNKINDINFVVLNNDEIVLRFNEKLLDIIGNILNDTKLEFNFDIFELEPLISKNNKMYYVKKFKDKKTIHTVPNYLYIQAFKKINNLEINENDLIFEYEGNLVKFIEAQF